MPPAMAAIIATLLGVLLLLQGCATLSRRDAVPVKDTTRAMIPGISNARFWVDADLNPLIREDIQEFEREEVEWAREGHRGSLPPAHYLAISGGGGGAFGAGLLVGWAINGELLARIAEEHRQGRLLFIGTTNLE